MTNLCIPEVFRKYIRTSNPLERLNRELKKKSNVIGIFPNTKSLMRLMGSILIEEHDKWSGKKCRNYYMPSIIELRKKTN